MAKRSSASWCGAWAPSPVESFVDTVVHRSVPRVLRLAGDGDAADLIAGVAPWEQTDHGTQWCSILPPLHRRVMALRTEVAARRAPARVDRRADPLAGFGSDAYFLRSQHPGIDGGIRMLRRNVAAVELGELLAESARLGVVLVALQRHASGRRDVCPALAEVDAQLLVAWRGLALSSTTR